MIPLYNVQVDRGVIPVLSQILEAGQIASGRYVDEFETTLKDFIGCNHLTTVGEMSSALTLSLFLAGIRPGDEVIASPMACLATNMPVLNLFARIVWCDIDPSNGGISRNNLAQVVSKKTKAILVFHWAGNPVDVVPIYELAAESSIPVIEDASESLGAQVGEKMVGNTGADYTVFSFYPNKHLTSIEGAAIAFRDADKYEEGRWLKRYGIHAPTFRLPDGELNPESDIKVPGWNSYLNNLNAAVGCHQMISLHNRVAKHKENGMYFEELLQSIPKVQVLTRKQNAQSSYWVFTLLCERRDELASHLKQNGVQASKVHLRNDLYSCFGQSEGKLTGVEEFCKKTLSVPCGWWVTKAQLEKIVDLIAEFFG